MTGPATPGWRYGVDPGEPAPGGPALLMLHGTGGDEREMLALGRSLAPGAPVLAPRGRVSERGAARFFSRTPRTRSSSRTSPSASTSSPRSSARRSPPTAWTGRPLVAVGYSNGANAAGGLMLRHPGLLAGGALLRPMLPAPGARGPRPDAAPGCCWPAGGPTR